MWSKPKMYVNAVADGTYRGTVFNLTPRTTLHSDRFAWLQKGQNTPLSQCSVSRGPCVSATFSKLNIFSHHISREHWKYFPLASRQASHPKNAVVARRNFISFTRRREVSSDRRQIISCPYSTRRVLKAVSAFDSQTITPVWSSAKRSEWINTSICR